MKTAATASVANYTVPKSKASAPPAAPKALGWYFSHLLGTTDFVPAAASSASKPVVIAPPDGIVDRTLLLRIWRASKGTKHTTVEKLYTSPRHGETDKGYKTEAPTPGNAELEPIIDPEVIAAVSRLMARKRRKMMYS